MQSSKISAEERVDRIRASLSNTLLPPPSSNAASSSGASSSKCVKQDSTSSSVGMASMIAAYARSKAASEETKELGVRAYLLKHNPDSLLNTGNGERRVTELNKTFLKNTIRSVESHNRREQVDSAWRQHDLLKRLDRGELYAPQQDERTHSEDSADHSDNSNSDHSVPTTSRSTKASGRCDRNENEDEEEYEEDFICFSVDRASADDVERVPRPQNRFLKNTIRGVSSHNRRLLRQEDHPAEYPYIPYSNSLGAGAGAADVEEGEEEQSDGRTNEEAVEVSFDIDRSRRLPSHLYTAQQDRESGTRASNKRGRTEDSDNRDSDSGDDSSSSEDSNSSGSSSDSESDRSRSASRDSRSRTSGAGAVRAGGSEAELDYQAQREMWAAKKAQALSGGVFAPSIARAINLSSTSSATFSNITNTTSDREKDNSKSHKSSKSDKRNKKSSKKDKKDKKSKDKKDKKEKKDRKDKREKKSKHKKHRN